MVQGLRRSVKKVEYDRQCESVYTVDVQWWLKKEQNPHHSVLSTMA